MGFAVQKRGSHKVITPTVYFIILHIFGMQDILTYERI
jgi:hypothetical protein